MSDLWGKCGGCRFFVVNKSTRAVDTKYKDGYCHYAPPTPQGRPSVIGGDVACVHFMVPLKPHRPHEPKGE